MKISRNHSLNPILGVLVIAFILAAASVVARVVLAGKTAGKAIPKQYRQS